MRATFKTLVNRLQMNCLQFVNQNKHAPTRLFCFHHGGGGASFFHPWLNQFIPNIQVIPVQLPGRESLFNENLYTNLDELIHQLVKIFRCYLEKPFFFWDIV